MSWLWVGLVFLSGASVGSFVNVMIERSIKGKDWIRGRSKCDHCGRTLAWYDMIPLLSYVLYRGQARCCGERLSLRHPMVETLFGVLFLWWLLMGFAFFRLAAAPLTVIQPLFWLVMGIMLLIIALADWAYGIILMPLVWSGLALTLVYRLVLYGFGAYQLLDLGWAILAGLLYGAFLQMLRWVTRGRGMGDGDPYLALWLGMILGWQRLGYGILAAFVTGAIVGLLLIWRGEKKMNSAMAFGPFMVMGMILGLLVA